MKENYSAKQTVSRLTLGARCDHKIVNELTRDLDALKMENERLSFKVRQLEKKAGVPVTRAPLYSGNTGRSRTPVPPQRFEKQMIEQIDRMITRR